MTQGARHVHLPEEEAALVVPINPARLLKVAIGSAVLGVLLVLICVASGAITQSFRFPFWLVLSLGFLVLAFAVLNFGIIWGRPVALRLDAHGISGYYSVTLGWSDISDVSIVDMDKERHLIFELHDAHAIRMRQKTAWARLRLIGGRVVVRSSVIDCELERIEAIAHRYLERDERKRRTVL